jgi:hypothetical protein
MTDQIQPEPTRPSSHNSADFTGTPDPLVDELHHRLRVLEQEKRRWKLIGVSALVALALAIVGGGIIAVGTAVRLTFQAKRAEMEAVMQAEQARMEAMRAQEAVEQARRQAQRAEEEAKRKAAQEVK